MTKRLSAVDADKCTGCQSCMFACSRRSLKFLKRIFEMPTPYGRLDEEHLRRAVVKYNSMFEGD